MEMASEENSQPSAYVSNHPENIEPQLSNHGDAETKCEITEVEVRGILEVIAATGKFWHEWDMLKSLLSFQLKQVLTEYPEAQMVPDQQASSLGETFPELVKRLDEALHSFIEGPPFTLQRLCEILLTARSIYPNLSKLALALEKNLLVTSTLTISSDPYPSTMKPGSEEPDKESSAPVAHSDAIQNGVETAATGGDEDEEMAEAEAEAEAKEVDEGSKSGNDLMNMAEESSSGTSETSSDQSTNSVPSGDFSPSSEEQQQQLNSTT